MCHKQMGTYVSDRVQNIPFPFMYFSQCSLPGSQSFKNVLACFGFVQVLLVKDRVKSISEDVV